MNIVHPNLNQISIVLVPPTGSGLSSVTLVQNQTDQNNNTNANIGISGANLGVVSANGDAIGTVFDDTAFRNIVDINFANGTRGASAPFIGRYQPEQRGGLSAYDGATAARSTAPGRSGSPTSSAAGRRRSSRTGRSTSPPGRSSAGTDVTAAVAVGLANAGGRRRPAVDTTPVLASDNTLGAFSQFQGRLYLAYVDRANPVPSPSDPADDGNIMLITSDDGGQSWSLPMMVNDDNSLVDGRTASDPSDIDQPRHRPGPVPARGLRVDQTTGTLAVSWLDTRYDASNGRGRPTS